jgi:hypothetical protein
MTFEVFCYLIVCIHASAPSAIINGRFFGVNDVSKVKFGETNVTLRCLSIQPSSVFIQNVGSGQEQELRLSGN